MLDRFRTLIFKAVAVAVFIVVGVNVSVRTFGGGYPHVLSPFHFENKVSALAKLGIHWLKHPFMGDTPTMNEIVRREAARANLPASFVRAVAKAESGLLPHRISSTGAMGVMQLMPLTAKDLGVDDPFDPRENIRGGAKYLRQLWNRYRGDQEKIAAAYNWGLSRVPKRKKLGRLPDETRHYVKRVLKLANRYKRQANK